MKAKDKVKEFSTEAIENYSSVINDEGKSKKILIIAGIVLCLMAVGWWFVGGEREEAKEANKQGNFAAYDEEVNTDEITVTEFSNHDEKIVGMWGPEENSLKDLQGSAYDAYYFYEGGTVRRAMQQNGDSMVEFGDWSTDDSGLLQIKWKNKDGSEFFTQVIEYKYTESEEDGKLLQLDSNTYYPMGPDAAVIF